MDTLKIILLIVILVLLCFFLMKKIEYFQATPTCTNNPVTRNADEIYKTYCLYEDTTNNVVSAEFNYVTNIWPVNINDMSVVNHNEFHNNKPEDKDDFQIMNFYELNGLDNNSSEKFPSKLTIYNNDNKNSSHYTVGFYFNIKSDQDKDNNIPFFNLYDNDKDDGTSNPVITMVFDKDNTGVIIKMKNNNIVLDQISIKYDVYNYVIIHIEQNKPPLIYLNDNINKNTKQNNYSIPPDFNLNKLVFQSSDGEVVGVDNKLKSNIKILIGRMLMRGIIVPIEELVREYSDNIDVPYYYTCPKSLFDLKKDGPFKDMNKCVIKCLDHTKYYATNPDTNCGIELCQKTCLECNKYNSEWNGDGDYNKRVYYCPWIKDLDDAKPRGPEPAIIRGIGGDGEITIEWMEPYNNNSPIIYYIINIDETYNSIPTKRINIVPNNIENKIQTYIIPDLKNKVSYEININPVNGIAIGNKSNTITVETIGEDSILSIDNIGSILEDKPINVDTSNYNCNYQKNIENHILDKITDEDIDIASMVKTTLL